MGGCREVGSVWCGAHIAADGFAPPSQICNLTGWSVKCLRELDMPMLPYFFHTDSPWVCEVTKPLKARCGSVGKKYECRNQVMVGWQTEGVHLSGHFNIQHNIFEHTLIYFDLEDKKKNYGTKPGIIWHKIVRILSKSKDFSNAMVLNWWDACFCIAHFLIPSE